MATEPKMDVSEKFLRAQGLGAALNRTQGVEPEPEEPPFRPDPTPIVKYWQSENTAQRDFRVIRACVTDQDKRPSWLGVPLSWEPLEFPEPEDAEDGEAPEVGKEYARLLAYRVGEPGRPIGESISCLDAISDLGFDLFAELELNKDSCLHATGKLSLDDAIGTQLVVIAMLEANPKRKRYGTALMRKFLRNCPPAYAIVAFAPGNETKTKATPDQETWEFLEGFGFSRGSGKSLLFSLPYSEAWGAMDPEGIRDLDAESTSQD